MPPEYSENSASRDASTAGRIVRRGVAFYLLGTVAVPVVCFIFGWRSLEMYGAGFMYGGLFMVVFGLFMAAGNALPFQLAGTKPAAGEGGVKRDDTGASAVSARRGARFFLATWIAGGLLGITGLLLRLPG